MKLCKLNSYTNLNRHVERDRHDGVQDDGVREEDEHPDDGGALEMLRCDDALPRQIRLKVIPDETFPNGCRHRAEAANRQQKEHNLEGQSISLR